MRAADSEWSQIRGEHRRAFKVGRRLGAALHSPLAWLNEQLTLVRDGLRRGDAEALSVAHAKRFPPASPRAAGDVPSSGLRSVG